MLQSTKLKGGPFLALGLNPRSPTHLLAQAGWTMPEEKKVNNQLATVQRTSTQEAGHTPGNTAQSCPVVCLWGCPPVPGRSPPPGRPWASSLPAHTLGSLVLLHPRLLLSPTTMAFQSPRPPTRECLHTRSPQPRKWVPDKNYAHVCTFDPRSV